jgi:hypothetical protein
MNVADLGPLPDSVVGGLLVAGVGLGLLLGALAMIVRYSRRRG